MKDFSFLFFLFFLFVFVLSFVLHCFLSIVLLFLFFFFSSFLSFYFLFFLFSFFGFFSFLFILFLFSLSFWHFLFFLFFLALSGLFLRTGEFIDRTISVTFPYVALSGVLYCGYISCVTYGFYAVVQMMGTEESERLLQESPKWGWRLFLGLPMIPVSLVTSRFRSFDALLPLVPVVILPTSSLRLSWPPSPSVIISLLPWVCVLFCIFLFYFFSFFFFFFLTLFADF